MLNLNRKGRVHSFFLAKYTQYGDTNPPSSGDVLDTDIAGSAPTWTRNAAGNYTLDFPAGSLSEDYAVAFVQIQGTSVALYCNVTVSDGQSVTILFRDEAGVVIEADCSFVVMLMNYTSPIPA